MAKISDRALLPNLRRRTLLRAAILASIGPWIGPFARSAGRQVAFVDYPFRLGVASGTPTATSVVLWTRLCPDALHDGGMGVQQVPMTWEVSRDERFGDIVRRGEWFAMAGRAHSAHVNVEGLEPDRPYWYRFQAHGEVSPTGRTRTLPLPGTPTSHLRFALASCQHFEHGYFSAYRHMLRDDPDLVLFVGDYIYEYNVTEHRVRAHVNAEPYSLQDYRTRYAQYHLDPDLQAMHQAAPWYLTIDDHEVMNDWAGDTGEDLDPNFVQRRADALQAYFEHVPLPMDSLLTGRRLALYRNVDVGDLIRFHILDDRQYRDPEPCSRPGMAGSNFVTDHQCPERRTPKRTMLGSVQEKWLDHSLSTSKTRWNALVQQSILSEFRDTSDQGSTFWTDAWDGYPAARSRLLEGLVKHKVSNPLVVGGDVHATIASNVKADFSGPQSKTLASEFVGTSITSPGMPTAMLDAKVKANPHVLYADADHRGYLLFDVRPKGLEVAARTVNTILAHDSICTTERRFHVESGRPGVEVA